MHATASRMLSRSTRGFAQQRQKQPAVDRTPDRPSIRQLGRKGWAAAGPGGRRINRRQGQGGIELGERSRHPGSVERRACQVCWGMR